MQRYERDEYEDLDEYESDGTEPEEEKDDEGGYEEEETFQPTQDELEYLELRERLKESIRKQMKKELGTANAGSRDKANTYRKDNYGSFFGPSQPVIAQRVIQESKSLLENPNLAARIVKPKYDTSKSSVTTNVRSKHQASQQTKVTSGLKKKVEMLKNTRDYSFLLSEDTEVPAPPKSPPRNVHVPKSEAQSTQLLSSHKQVVNDRGREASNGHEHRKQLISGSQTKVGPEKIDRTSRLSVESRKQLSSNSGIGPGRPLDPKPIPSRSGSNSGSGPGRPLGPKPIPSRSGSNSGSGPGRPLGPKSVPSRSGGPSLGTKATQSIAKNALVAREKSNPSSSVQSIVRKPTTSYIQSGVRKPIPSSSQSSLMKNQSVQRKEYQETSKPKIIPKQTLPSSRHHVNQQSTKVPARSTLADVRPKAKVGRQPYADDSDDDKAINMIRKMFGYNPNKYQDADDDSDMEANFDDILREEKRSAKIAMREDEEELRKIEEEEKRRLARKRKLSH